MIHKFVRVGRKAALVLPHQTLKEMGIGLGERVRVTYNPDFRELVVRPLKKHGKRR